MSGQIPKLPHVYTEGDTKPFIVGVLSGTNLTGFTVNIRMSRNDGTPLVKTATITNALQGEFTITWAILDLVPGCDQPVDIEFVEPSLNVFTSRRFLMDVKEKIQ